MPFKKTAILLSGGMDSLALAYWKKPSIAFTIDYGQVAVASEVKAARYQATILNMEHLIIRVDCSSLGSGLLSSNGIIDIAPSPEWWPFRNQLLITLASMKALQLGIDEILVGSVKEDSQYVDGRKDFYERLNEVVNMQEGHLNISTPSIDMTTEELIKVSGIKPSLLLAAHSCSISDVPCQKCPSCLKHERILGHLGLID